jgi:hypothetical protein
MLLFLKELEVVLCVKYNKHSTSLSGETEALIKKRGKKKNRGDAEIESEKYLYKLVELIHIINVFKEKEKEKKCCK